MSSHFLVLMLKTLDTSTKGNSRGSVHSAVTLSRTQCFRVIFWALLPLGRGRLFYSCLRCCNMSTDTPSCFTKLDVCSRIQVRLGFSKCACSCVLQHSGCEQSIPFGLLSESVLISALLSPFASSAGTTWQRFISSMESNKSVTRGCDVTDFRRLSTHSSHWPTASRRLFILLIKVELLPWR